jgi:chromosome segregation ATPase
MFKTIFRIGAIGTVAVGVLAGGALLIAGPHRTRAVLHQVQGDLMSRLDKAIDDPTALRSQLQELEAQYPERIAQLRGDLAELNEQIRQLEREEAISERVVEMARADLEELQPLLDEASAAQAAQQLARPAAIHFDDKVWSYDRAAAKAGQIRQTAIAYSNRAANADHDLAYLRQQAQRIEEALVELENERAEFQGQIWQLSRQVDAIARNERLIDMLDERNKTLEECSRYDAVSLDQITGRLSEIRSRQEAELDLLANSREEDDYEEMARMQLRGESLDGPADTAYRAETGWASSNNGRVEGPSPLRPAGN